MSMQTMRLGKTDLQVSSLCLGTANFGEKLDREAAWALLDGFVAAGGNLIDTANVYCRWVPGMGNIGEEMIGAWLAARQAYDRVLVATKGGHYSFDAPAVSRVTPRAVAQDLEESLRTLGLAQIPLYWLHRDDEAKPVGEIIDMMEAFVKAGKIRYYGASNYTLERVKQAEAYAAQQGVTGFSALSNQWSLAEVSPGANPNPDPSLVMMDAAYYSWHTASGMPMLPFSSSAHGFFEKLHRAGAVVREGKLAAPLPFSAVSEELQRAYINPRNLRLYEKLEVWHARTGVPVHSLSIAALRTAPFEVLPVAAVSSTAQLEQMLAAGEGLPEEDWFAEFGV